MTIMLAVSNPSKKISSVKGGQWRPAIRLACCTLFLLMCAGPMLLAADMPAAQQSATSQTTVSTAETQQQAKLQAKRQAEIRQRKIDNPEAEEGENVYRHSPMVHSLAKRFGLSVEATSRLFEIINFILLVIILVWGIWKILPKALHARTDRIRNGLQQARTATEDANRRLAGIEERLSHLDGEIDAIRKQAEQETVIEEKRLRAALEQEKQSILESAAQDINAASKNAQSQLKKLAAELVIEHAKRQISVTPEADQTLVAGFLAELNEKHSGGGVN